MLPGFHPNFERPPARQLLVVALLVSLAARLALHTRPVYAASFTVNSTADTSDATPGECTLRAAMSWTTRKS